MRSAHTDARARARPLTHAGVRARNEIRRLCVIKAYTCVTMCARVDVWHDWHGRPVWWGWWWTRRLCVRRRIVEWKQTFCPKDFAVDRNLLLCQPAYQQSNSNQAVSLVCVCVCANRVFSPLARRELERVCVGSRGFPFWVLCIRIFVRFALFSCFFPHSHPQFARSVGWNNDECWLAFNKINIMAVDEVRRASV